MLCRFFLTGFILASAAASRILIENFDQPTLTWTQQNDPVMGGASVGTFAIKSGAGVFDGKVVDVPRLKAPGFIKVDARGKFPDVSSCSALVINAHAASNYTGYRVSFGTAHVPGGAYAYGYKAHLDAPTDASFSVTIPFNQFSDDWDDATGDLKTTCAQNKEYCPDADTRKDMRTLSLWGEGVAGDVHLEVKSIEATGCEAMVEELGAEPSSTNSCSGPIQANLRYNLSHTNAAQGWALPVPPGETLASAVCCDAGYKAYAEPPQLFARDDVALFKHMNKNGTTTFYDSVCGIPLFVVPQGRTMAEFEADTTEHGWPSFRKEEIVAGNSLIVNETGEVLSKCGTHLGSYLPDDKGPRWCLDLSCVSGNPK